MHPNDFNLLQSSVIEVRNSLNESPTKKPPPLSTTDPVSEEISLSEHNRSTDSSERDSPDSLPMYRCNN